jgi:hypothetical protein
MRIGVYKKISSDNGVRVANFATSKNVVPNNTMFSEVENDTEKLKSYKFPGTDQIPSELIKAGGETLCSEVHKLICSI